MVVLSIHLSVEAAERVDSAREQGLPLLLVLLTPLPLAQVVGVILATEVMAVILCLAPLLLQVAEEDLTPATALTAAQVAAAVVVLADSETLQVQVHHKATMEEIEITTLRGTVLEAAVAHLLLDQMVVEQAAAMAVPDK